MRFSQVVGQDRVKAHLLQMVQGGQLPHALMFCGPKGAGKMALALAYARYLLCKSPSDGDACGTCSSCRMLDAYSHPDLHFSFPVYKRKSTDHPVSDDFMPQWRELLAQGPYFDMEAWLAACKADNQQLVHYVYESDALRSKLMLKSNQGGRKVVVMWLPEKMNIQCSNKLLKLIEDPLPGVRFIFVSNNPGEILPTIYSRLQRVEVKRLADSEVASYLAARHAIDPADAMAVAHLAEGSLLEAEKIYTDNAELTKFLEFFQSLMRLAYQRKIALLKKWSQDVAALGREQSARFCEYCQRQTRENFIANIRVPGLNYLTRAEQTFSSKFSPFINERNVEQLSQLFDKARIDILANGNAKIIFFDVAVKVILLLKK